MDPRTNINSVIPSILMGILIITANQSVILRIKPTGMQIQVLENLRSCYFSVRPRKLWNSFGGKNCFLSSLQRSDWNCIAAADPCELYFIFFLRL